MSNAPSKSVPAVNLPPAVPDIPWNPWWGVGFVLLTFLGSQLLVGTLLSIYPAVRHWTEARTLNWLNDSVSAQFLYTSLTELLIIGLVYLFLRWYKRGFAVIGLRRPRWIDPLYGLAGLLPYFVLYLLAVGVASYLLPGLDVDQKQQLGFNDVAGGGQLLMTFVSLVILPPLAEEIMVRGLLYSSFKKALPTVHAVIFTSALFAAAHLPEGGPAGPLYIAGLDTFVISLVLIYLREKTGSLWPGITLHALKNGVAFSVLFVFHAH